MSKPQPTNIVVGKITFGIWTRGDGYVCFDYKDPGTGKRKHCVRKTIEELKKAAQAIAPKLLNGETDALQLNAADCREHVAARTLLEPWALGIAAGARLVDEAAKILGDPHRIVEAARWFAQANPGHAGNVTIADLVAEFIRSRRTANLTEVYVDKLERDLKLFADNHPGPVAAIRTEHIEDFINAQRTRTNQPVGARRRLNLREAFVTLFNYAQDRGHLPANLRHQAEKTHRPKIRRGEVPIWTPAEMQVLLEHARDTEIPPLAIAAFAGLRSAEISRLDWTDIRFDQNVIRISGHKTKTGQPRVVPILPNLAEWLAPYREKHGRVCENPRLDLYLRQLYRRAGFHTAGRNRRNALRHSFGTYYCAKTKNVAEVAFTMGNSPGVVKKSYFEAVTETDAEKWFNFRPGDFSKVLRLRFA